MTKHALLAAPAVGFASLFAEVDVSRQLSDIQSSSSRSQLSLVLFPHARLLLVLAFSLPVVLLLGGIRLATVAVIMVLQLVARAMVA